MDALFQLVRGCRGLQYRIKYPQVQPGAPRPALALALCGEAAAAGKLAAIASRRQPNGTLWNAVHLPAIRAAMDIRSGHPDKALAGLAPAAPFERVFPEAPYLRALAQNALRNPAAAAAEYRKLLDHPGANSGVFYGLARGKEGRATPLSQ